METFFFKFIYQARFERGLSPVNDGALKREKRN